MNTQQKKEQNVFVKKEALILKAIDKVKFKLKAYKRQAAKIKGSWTDEDREKFSDWNSLHDLEYRLQNRFDQNVSNWHQWRFDTFGWTAY